MVAPSSFGPATVDRADLIVRTLGTARIDSPLAALLGQRQRSTHYFEEFDRVLLDDTVSAIDARAGPPPSCRPSSRLGRAKSISILPKLGQE